MEQVQVAVKSLHTPGDAATRRHALTFLERFQNSVEKTEGTMECRFFAAQTLKHKIVSDYSQLEEGMARALKTTLWAFVRGERGKTVGAQLVLGLAALIVQTTDNGNTVGTLLDELDAVPEGVLGVLGCVPEQLANPLIHMTGIQLETQKRQLLELNVDRVIATVTTRLAGNEHREALLTCLLAWIKYGPASPDVIGSERILGTLLQTLLEDVQNEATTLRTGCEVLCELFFRLFQISDAPSEGFLRVLLEGLDRLRPALQHLLKNDDSHGEEETLALTVGRIYLEAGEAFLPWILNDPRAMQIVLEAALMLAENASGNLKMVEATFPFWSLLEERLSGANETLREPFVPVLERLFRSLVSLHLAFPLSDTMSAEERDQFRDFRHVIGDCLKDCTRIIGSTAALFLIVTMLKEADVAQSWEHVGGDANQSSWQRVEAILFSLRTISSSVDRRESEAMPVIAAMLLRLVQGAPNPKLVYSVVLNIGCYADWVRYHVEFLSPFLAVLGGSIGEHPAATAMALKYLCQSCASLMVTHETTLRSLYIQSISCLAAREMQDLSEAVSNVLLAVPEEAFSHLFPPYVSPWLPLLTSKPADALDNLAVFIEVLSRPSPAMDSFVGQLLPHLPAVVDRGHSHEPIMDSLVMLLRAVVAHHPKYSLTLMDLLDLMFARHSISGALYVIRHVVMCDPPVLPYVRTKQCLHSALDVAESRPAGLSDLMQLATAILDFYDQFLDDPLLARVLNMCQVILAADPVTPSELIAALSFLAHLLQHSRMSMDGVATCIHSILRALPQLIPTNILPDVAAVLRRHHILDPVRSCAYFSALLAALPSLTDRERSVWLEKFGVAAEGKPREMKEMLGAFIAVCRRRL